VENVPPWKEAKLAREAHFRLCLRFRKVEGLAKSLLSITAVP
jgi:hypothetical protein